MKTKHALLLLIALFPSVLTHSIAAQNNSDKRRNKSVVFKNTTKKELSILLTAITEYAKSNRSSGKISSTYPFKIAALKTTEDNRYSIDFGGEANAVCTCVLEINKKKTRPFKVENNSKTLNFILTDNLSEAIMVEV